MNARPPAAPQRGPFRRWRRVAIAVYGLLLVASHVWQRIVPPAASATPRNHAVALLAQTNDDGQPVDGTWALAFRDLLPQALDPARPVIVLLHGSPGGADDFDRLLPRLTSAGYRVIVPDLLNYALHDPGADAHPPASRSIMAYARAVLELLDQLHVRRAHVVGWSNGGGVAQHMADLAPDRIASLTMMASIGLDKYEWSGSHWFEHAKHTVGMLALGGVPEFIPHFGALGSFQTRTAWLAYFRDTDQRLLEGAMRRIGERGTPTLILHGRHDMLVPWQAAAEHHALIASSRLVMLDANHFLPFMQVNEVADALSAHFARHDTPGVPALTGVDDRCPEPEHRGMDAWIQASRDDVRWAPWWMEVACLALLALWSPAWTIVIAGLFVVGIDLDPAIAFVGVSTGFGVQTFAMAFGARALGDRIRRLPWIGRRLPRISVVDWRRRLTRGLWAAAMEGYHGQFFADARVHSALGAGLASSTLAGERSRGRAHAAFAAFLCGRGLAIAVWTGVSVVVLIITEALVVGPIRQKLGLFGVAYTLIKLYLVANLAPMLLTRGGRQHLLALLGRLLHHEYWPTWAFYLPLVPYLAYLAMRHRGVSTATCCNPEILPAGGWAGESKYDIMSKLAGPEVLETWFVPAGEPGHRGRRIRALIESGRVVLPVVLKPDQGQRGHAFKVCRDWPDVESYLAEMTGDAVVQPYHPGPLECGILWTRTPGSDRGTVYAITRKEFPTISGDGVRTLEQLVRDHPRYRKQAAVFLDRFVDEASRVLEPGEEVRLAMSGNHCQGTLFRDGEDLRTPELEAAIDRLARSFPRLDIGRFDIRYESDELLRGGRGMGVVELNGITSEPTNMYDPARSPLFAYRVLFGLWRRIYALGAERRAQGVAATSVLEVWRIASRQRAAATGSAVAD